MNRIFVTGANGFIGRHLCENLSKKGFVVYGSVRKQNQIDNIAIHKHFVIDNIGPDTNWGTAVHGCDTVIHLASRVHVMHDTSLDPLAAFRLVNTAGTKQLASEAAAAGVRRFVYVSSIKVNGESTSDRPFTAEDIPAPEDDYAQSKYEAEMCLREIESKLGLEVVIVRPPLVYGPGVKGNLQRLMWLIEKGIPLPFASIINSRSLVGIDNLCNLLIHCVESRSAAGNTFLVSDGNDVSTPELLHMIGEEMHKPVRLIRFPRKLLQQVMSIIGYSSEFEKLSNSLQVDINNTCELLGWSPDKTTIQGIADMVKNYLENKTSNTLG